MRRNISILLFLIALFSITVVFADDLNLVKNSGFEEGALNDFSSWTNHAWGDKPGLADFLIVDKEAHSGSRSALIVNNLLTDARLKQKIDVKANTYYRLSCWVKTENVPASAKGANISVDGILDTSKDIKNTSNWELIELYGKTGKDQKSILLTIGLGGYGSINTGKAWFDDISVEVLSKAPEGMKVVNLFPTAAAAKGLSSAIWALLFIALIGVLLGYLFISYTTSKKIKRKHNHSPTLTTSNMLYYKLKVDRKDIYIISVMTIVYLAIALINLGSLKVPQSSWQPERSEDGFVVDFGREISLDRIYYYSGLGDGKFRIEYLNSSGSFVQLVAEEKKNIFVWKHIDAPAITNKLKFIFDTPGPVLNEIAFTEKGKTEPVIDLKLSKINSEMSQSTSLTNLIDEQDYFAYKPSYMTGMYFDEIYHARTAFEHINRIQPYEWTHPPLGKLIISLGVLIFGMNPFGWRIMGTLFGAAMIPFMYLFGKKLFEKRFFAFCSAFLMMFDFMHFTQTRIATIDVYGTFFIIVMYYYMYDYFVNKSYNLDFKESLKPLFLSGLIFGIGVSSKWIAAYGGAGLAVLFFTAKALEYNDYRKLKRNSIESKPKWVDSFIRLNIIATMLYCVLFFVIIPGIIYSLAYIPYMLVPGAKPGLKLVIDNQVQMYSYHSKLVATHSFSSPWYEWPVIYKPTWFYSGSDLPQGTVSTIVTMGNPAIWWIGIIAIIMAVMISINKRDKKMGVIIVAIAFQYLPWVLVSRITWIYHFFSTVPFMILCIVYVIKNITEAFENTKYLVYIYLGIVVVLFICFYPALSGLEVSKAYIDGLKWFNSWVF